MALERTPRACGGDRRRRTLATAEFLFLSGELGRAKAVLEAAVGEFPAGGERADALMRLATWSGADLRTVVVLGKKALAHAARDERRQSLAHLLLGRCWTVRGMRYGLAHARQALEHAERASDRLLLVRVLAGLTRWELWAGELTPGLLERAVALEQPAGELRD